MNRVKLVAHGGQSLLAAVGLDLVVREGRQQHIEAVCAFVEPLARDVSSRSPSSPRTQLLSPWLEAPQRLEAAHGRK